MTCPSSAIFVRLFLYVFAVFLTCLGHVCRDKCNDGGCEYTVNGDTDYKCDCGVQKEIGLQYGTFCESFVDACKTPRCEFGECLSSLGRSSCECTADTIGDKCNLVLDRSDPRFTNLSIPLKPTLFLRTKARPLEIINSFITFKHDPSLRLGVKWLFYSTDTFYLLSQRPLYHYSNMITYEYCVKTISSEHFPANQKVCDSLKTAYGTDVTVTSILFPPFCVPKTKMRTDVYYNTNGANEDRIGGLRSGTISVIHNETNVDFHSYNYTNLIVDDETSYCTPFVGPGKNCRGLHSPLKVKRSEDVPLIQIDITPDNNKYCDESKKYTLSYEWIVTKKFEPTLDPKRSFSVKLDRDTATSRDLIIRRHILPKGVHYAYFKLIKTSQENKIYENRFMCHIDVSYEKLHAEIVGSPFRLVGGLDLVTLNASLSFNPNEPSYNQDHIVYTWSCDVKMDNENCQEYSTNSPIRELTALLDKAHKYTFTLKTRVNDEYAKISGVTGEDTAKIILLPEPISIKCIKNCDSLSSPSEIVYLLVVNNIKNRVIEWYYKEVPGSTFIPAKAIKESNVPSHVFITKKHSLNYNTTYAFKAKVSNSDHKSFLVIKTAAKPVAGECHIHPPSGIAGLTLFNITCSNFHDDDSLSYDIYERYEGDQNGFGVLIGRGSSNYNSVYLSKSGKLNILATNSYGLYAKVTINVEVIQSGIDELNNLFKITKTQLQKKNISITIQMISIISELLQKKGTTNDFSMLFKIMSKLPSKRSFFTIEQIVLVLEKVTRIYSAMNDHRIPSSDTLAISTNLLLAANNTFEYLKSLQYKDTIAYIERIQRIFVSLKNTIDALIGNNDPIVYTQNRMNPTRYFFSSMENIAQMTRNVEETIKIFGESIIFHDIAFEKRKMFKSKESYFWAKMLDAEFLDEQNDVIGHDLAKELLSKEKTEWGLKVFEFSKKLTLWAELSKHRVTNGVQSKIKYVGLSAHDQSSREYLGLIHKLVFPASITFNIPETVDKSMEDYVIRVPAANSNQIEFDKAVLSFKLDMMQVGAIYVSISQSTHALLITWTSERRPDLKLMRTERYVTKISAGKGFALTLQTNKDHRNKTHYLGLFADIANNDPLSGSFEVKFRMSIICMKCVRFKNDLWSFEGMQISSDSSVDGYVHCLTDHLSMFSSSIFIFPNLLNPIEEIHLFSTIADNMVCLVFIAIIFVIYAILLIWSSIKDKKDILMGRIIILADNYVGEDEVYMVTVHTGHSPASGTTANVCIELIGSDNSSRAHWLHSPHYRTLQRSNDDWFIVCTPQSLGELRSVHLWHDNYGAHPDWYCKRVVVTEIRTNRYWTFEVERWFSLCRPGDRIEHTVSVAPFVFQWTRTAKEYASAGFREKHMWASVFIRHPRSPITRCQRLSLILCTVLSVMLASMIFYELKHTDEEQFTTFSLKMREFLIAFQSALVEIVLTYGVHLCFKRGRQVHMDEIMRKKQKIKSAENELGQPKQEKALNFIKKRLAEKNFFYPVDTETVKQRHQWNRWYILGWTCCFVVYILTAFYIILYGLKFGRVKSFCWLTSTVIGLLQGILVGKPLKIFVTSAILAKIYSMRQKSKKNKDVYKLTMDRFRTKTRHLLQDVQYVEAIRKNRRRYLYTPLTDTATDVLRERRKYDANKNNFKLDLIVCIVLIMVSLFCLHTLGVFSSQPETYQTNRITSKYSKQIIASSNLLVTLNGLKKLVSKEFFRQFHSLELYNGEPITNESLETINYHKVGWFGLYNSRLIGGGVRLRQTRVKSDGKIDDGSYDVGWKKSLETDNSTEINAWKYSKTPSRKYLFFSSADSGGFDLHLVDSSFDTKLKLSKHLKSNWLDQRTKSLYVQFQTYIPGTDSMTVVKVHMVTDCGLLYTISAEAHAMPAEGTVANWRIRCFTVAAILSLVLAAVVLLFGTYRRLYTRFDSSLMATVVSDGLLLFFTVLLAEALFRRLNSATIDDTWQPTLYVDLWPACCARESCVFRAAELAVAAAFRLYWHWRPVAVSRRQSAATTAPDGGSNE